MCDDGCDLTTWNHQLEKKMRHSLDTDDSIRIAQIFTCAVALSIFLIIVGFIIGVVAGEGRAYKTLLEQQNKPAIETTSDTL